MFLDVCVSCFVLSVLNIVLVVDMFQEDADSGGGGGLCPVVVDTLCEQCGYNK